MTSSTENAPAQPKRDEDKIVIFDTTLRDGEQAAKPAGRFQAKSHLMFRTPHLGRSSCDFRQRRRHFRPRPAAYIVIGLTRTDTQ